ncbi:universal stress protein [Paraglaciecola arctica]|uniref:UspA protein n=1 Tax=Paraglaciecola arctica BSs20135 TaxID=493475 RepID=K6XAM2_9ALTE|nr:universal stress protein [Paraglaciecola arctica]GAC17679.1 UspA protein [Paraglaciecola arctica BSs20135]
MKRFKNFLYVMNHDISEPSPSLLRAVSLAKNNQADLTLLLVIPKLFLPSSVKKVGMGTVEMEKTVFAREQENLLQLAKTLDKDVNVKVLLKVGKRYLESVRLVLSQNVDMLIKEVDKVSWLDRLIGSDDMHLLRNCPCPVWLMKKDEKPDYKQVLAAVDFDSEDDETCNDELNHMILALSCSIALAEFSTVHVVTAYNAADAGFIGLWASDPENVEKQMLESEFRNSRYQMDLLFHNLNEEIGNESFNYLSLIPHLVKGRAGEELPKIAKSIGADLVVMGTIARTGIAGLVIGNTAETILNQLNSSVLAIKPKGFVSPIS